VAEAEAEAEGDGEEDQEESAGVEEDLRYTLDRN